jgi:phospholipase C
LTNRREFMQIGLAAACPAVDTIPPGKIKHVVVLMLENRSFDHMLAFSGVNGTELPHDFSEVDSQGGTVRLASVKTDPETNVDPDPDHDFNSVMYQMYGRQTYEPSQPPTMDHFVLSYQQACQNAKTSGAHPTWSEADIVRHSHNVMACHAPEDVPVLVSLARNYALCTNWYSSLPGPTIPNRLFAHFGTSGGRVDLAIVDFEDRPTIYEVLNQANVSSTIYAGGWTVAATFPRLTKYQDQYFGSLDDFYQDCADDDLPGYCFIEPRYGSEVVDGVFRPQNDQHPDADLRDGEELILSVYHAIRSRPEIWETSVLIITYDEHGGIFDHCPPPPAVNPDGCCSSNPWFDFTRYGVRVPAVIVSPYTCAGTIVSQVCDHTSFLACARKLLTGKNDNQLGLRAQKAYPLDSAFGPERVHTEFAIPFEAARHSRNQSKTINHLQQAHLEMAKMVEDNLPAGRGTGINRGKIKTGQDAQHYVRRVYALAAGFPTPKGRKCGCS